MKLSAFVNQGAGAAAAVQRAAALEDAGIDVIGVAEAYGVDGVSLLGYLAARTSRVELMSQIMPLYTRTPTLTAMTAAGLDLMSGGRFLLGLGASGPQVIEGFHGVPYDAPLGRTREVVQVCRQVWRRERVVHDGEHYQVPLPAGQGTGLGKPLKLINHPVRERIPVYLAALGDRNVELTAEVAEGWITFLFLPERAHLVWGDALARGAKLRDPSLGPLQVCAGGPLAIGKDVTALRDRARPTLALYLGGMGARGRNFYNNVAQRYGFAEQAALVQDLYLDGRKDEAAAAVPAELLEGSSLIGDEGYVRDRLRAYADAGVTMLQIDPVGADPVADVRRLRELVEDL
ncbi:MAG: putative F420-dependent oxidoreductase, Rv3520c family [Frankiales bacterium]|nr:putative F420-dependent oxidoreductase, Rv3520c family [Frankiales bacterium]